MDNYQFFIQFCIDARADPQLHKTNICLKFGDLGVQHLPLRGIKSIDCILIWVIAICVHLEKKYKFIFHTLCPITSNTLSNHFHILCPITSIYFVQSLPYTLSYHFHILCPITSNTLSNHFQYFVQSLPILCPITSNTLSYHFQYFVLSLFYTLSYHQIFWYKI